MRGPRWVARLLLTLACAPGACAPGDSASPGGGDGAGPRPGDWGVEALVFAEHVEVTATIARYHADFIHMSLRKQGWRNDYSVDGSPAPRQPRRDWSRVHRWFGELHPDTFLEGRIDDGSGQGPTQATTFRFLLPRWTDLPRQDFPDEAESDYRYITSIYGYADGHGRHPQLSAGDYEVEIYAWYTGPVDADHPAVADVPEVQYVHHEAPLASARFTIE